MDEIDVLSQELVIARQNQADALMMVELSGGIFRRLSYAIQQATTFEKLQTLARFIDKSIELTGLGAGITVLIDEQKG